MECDLNMSSLQMNNDGVLLLPDGMRVGYARYGRAGGVPAFYFHGLPGSRREGALLHQACSAANLDLIAPERPGYGLSQSMPPAMSSTRHRRWTEVIAALADQLGFERFYVIGISGGAPYALACASVFPARVRATSICCGLGDISQTDLRRVMGLISRAGFFMAARDPALLKLTYGNVATAAARLAPGLAVDAMCWLNRKVDRIALQPPAIKAIFTENLREAFRHGAGGGIADLQAAVGGWGFDVAQIASLQLWHGDRDGVVPHRHSEWLARQIPAAQLKIVAGEGHFSLPVRYAHEIVQTLVSEFPL
ncbi:MAG: alpha/beta hydrolase [Gammaproteobacteria bacterium]|nr:alpha/beta hydrolase [Gammaproteobacteria bacterium]